MLKIIFDVLPFGSDERSQTIKELYIWNTGQEKSGYCKYRWAWDEPNPGVLPDEQAAYYPSYVWHRREKGAVELVRHVLEMHDWEGQEGFEPS